MAQGRDPHNPMEIYPQATKLATVPFLSTSVRNTLKSHWQIRGLKGLWRYRASVAPGDEEILRDEIIAWFYPRYGGNSIRVSYGRFFRDKALEDILKRMI